MLICDKPPYKHVLLKNSALLQNPPRQLAIDFQNRRIGKCFLALILQ